jgi:hypothetical protein
VSLVLTDEQTSLVATVREFCARECGLEVAYPFLLCGIHRVDSVVKAGFARSVDAWVAVAARRSRW